MAISKITTGSISDSVAIDTDTLVVDGVNNRVGIGDSAPSAKLVLRDSSDFKFVMSKTGASAFEIANNGTSGTAITVQDPYPLIFGTNNTERLRLDSSGNVLVGSTVTPPAQHSSVTGISLRTSGAIEAAASSGNAGRFNRLSNDGGIVEFRKDGSTVGTIGCTGTNTYIAFRTEANGDGTGLRGSGSSTGAVIPTNGDGVARDDAVDLGGSSSRFDDIYATNGTIQTSDANEKQQIAALTDAEITAAKAISQLFKTFKWNRAVEAKGDAARTHTGVIAQDVEAAMTAAGLDAGDYAFFISSTWYVDADGNEVEADAEGAIEKNRKGIRYPELLAFVGAATEQRLANIETRLAALEAN